MSTQQKLTKTSWTLALVAPVAIGAAALLMATPDDAQAGSRASKAWRSAAKKLRSATKAELKADYALAKVRALMIADAGDRREFLAEAREDFKDENEIAGDAYKARLELAEALGEDELYTAPLNPADFVSVVDNPYFPLTVGTTRTYRANVEEGIETIVVTVLPETKVILGITCTVVRDTVSLDGVLIEDTFDWYAQDTTGNVWYLGEIALNYEDGDITDVDGSWISGVDTAQPGIVMPAAPTVGHVYRQEFLIGEAEDYAEILSTTASASVPFGNFTNCVQTFDGIPLEPDVEEHKYYAAGIGPVLEIDIETGERVELISVTTDD